jgi:predicted GH43/DUF377 family glycosyl hydrolase
MSAGSLVRRSPIHLLPDPSRVLTRPFLPGLEAQTHGISRAESVVERILALPDDEVVRALASILSAFNGRHADLRATFREHFELVSHRLPEAPGDAEFTDDRIDLVGAYLTQEFAIEGAALFNPSIVAHPDQSGCGEGELRFIMSARAVGEGHLSSVEFRTGILGPDDALNVDEPGRHLTTGRSTPLPMSATLLRASLDQHGDAIAAESILRLLPATFTSADLDEVLALSALDSPGRDGNDALLERIRRTAATMYRLAFPEARELSERVIVPHSSAESHGIEDVRFVSFDDRDGRTTYFGTYTAFDGERIAPHLLQTDDFLTFSAGPMIGPAAQNKGMALFPRRISGDMWSLSRWDRENISVARSADGVVWGSAQVVATPHRPWDLIQLGACSSPVETPEGWLVLTHGVGPMRVYSVGAMLLALDDPTRVLGVLDEPLLTPDQDEREGYVPNVVYSCGALVHGDALVVPYGCSDSSIRFVFVDLPGLLARLLNPSTSESPA